LRAAVLLAAVAAAFAAGYAVDHRRPSSVLPQDGGAKAVLAPETVNAALWHQTSGEYRAVTTQIYGMARRQLERALADRSWTAAVEQTNEYADLPPAIILDLDETVFVTASYQARMALELGQYSPTSFNAWCKEAKAAGVAGAAAFLSYAAERGVAVFYTSGRPEDVRSATIANLESLGYPVQPGGRQLLLSPLTESDRRREVARRYRILLLFGDNLDDFVDGSKVPAEERRALAEKYSANWGVKWMILPNAMYGHWDATLYDFDYAAAHDVIFGRKVDSLRTEH
jgi:acid phosphatase